MLIEGRKIADKLNRTTEQVIDRLKQRGKKPKVVVFLVGQLKESEVYVRQKRKKAEELGFDFVLKKYSSGVAQKELISSIKKSQNCKRIVGCLVQLPLPKGFDTMEVLSAIKPEYDIDCLTRENMGRLLTREAYVIPPTAGAIMSILKNLKTPLKGSEIVMVGAGLLVGRPTMLLLSESGATITLCNHHTKNLSAKTKTADIVITGAGKKDLITTKMVKSGAVVIDAGFVYENGRVYGDADVTGLDKKGVKVTPTPGGVGPVTVATLLANAAKCAELRFKK